MTIGENELLFAKVKQDAIIPSKREEDAGMDIYACFEDDFIFIKPHETKLISTGIASALNPKYYIQLEERGSTGTKGIKKSAGVIDSGYRNEWFVVVSNVNDIPVVIAKENIDTKDIFGDICINYIRYPYEKAIAQAIIHKVQNLNITELTYQELLMIESERGTGRLGSSNK